MMSVYAGVALLAVMGALFVFLMIIASKCKHAWEFVDKTELPSRMEEARKHSISLSNFLTTQVDAMLEKKVVIVLRCLKCGATKVLRESNL